MKRNYLILQIISFIFFLIVIFTLPYGFSLFQYAFSPTTSQGSPQEGTFMIEKGKNPNELTLLLLQKGIIQQGKNFIWLGRLTRQWKHIKYGEYYFSSKMTPLQILSILTSGVSIKHPITVREGENMYEIAEELEQKGIHVKNEFLSLCQSTSFIESLGYFQSNPPQRLEGYLFPDTYFLTKNMTSAEIIKQMVHHFFNHWKNEEEQRAQALSLTRHELVTLASMIEKETGAPEERALISSVFHNRLRIPMKLQSDPTTIYGIWDRFQGKIHKRDLLEKNHYNTYQLPGLPIGPIANPGQAALKAALFPEKTDYLYFVSRNEGTHRFSQTFQEHQQAVKKYQLDPQARAGKSWRDRIKNRSLMQD